jgi:hypothetical protein
MPTSTVRAWRRVPLITALLLGAGVAVMLGVLGRVRGPAGDQLPTFGFSDTVTFKAWTATVVLVLATVQLLTALGMYRHLPRLHHMPQWLHAAHRATGIAALVLSLPVAGYCLYSFGFAPAPLSPRTLIHSIAGCTFYGGSPARSFWSTLAGCHDGPSPSPAVPCSPPSSSPGSPAPYGCSPPPASTPNPHRATPPCFVNPARRGRGTASRFTLI